MIRCRCRAGYRWLFVGSEQYNPEGDFWKQFVHQATKLCPPESLPRQRGILLRQLCSHPIVRLDPPSRFSIRTEASRASSHSPASTVFGELCDERRDIKRENRCLSSLLSSSHSRRF